MEVSFRDHRVVANIKQVFNLSHVNQGEKLAGLISLPSFIFQHAY